jgi:hypothetical protein
VRDLADIIDIKAAAQSSMLKMLNPVKMTPISDTVLQQDVVIHAEFPNVTQRTEIEAAFDTLINRASQFANRKN